MSRECIIKIRCSEETLRIWKAYVAMSGHRTYEEALIDLLKKTGWFNAVKTAQMVRSTVF